MNLKLGAFLSIFVQSMVAKLYKVEPKLKNCAFAFEYEFSQQWLGGLVIQLFSLLPLFDLKP